MPFGFKLVLIYVGHTSEKHTLLRSQQQRPVSSLYWVDTSKHTIWAHYLVRMRATPCGALRLYTRPSGPEPRKSLQRMSGGLT